MVSPVYCTYLQSRLLLSSEVHSNILLTLSLQSTMSSTVAPTSQNSALSPTNAAIIAAGAAYSCKDISSFRFVHPATACKTLHEHRIGIVGPATEAERAKKKTTAQAAACNACTNPRMQRLNENIGRQKFSTRRCTASTYSTYKQQNKAIVV